MMPSDSNSSPPKYRAIVFIGAPGSGKGTQSRAVGQLPGYYWFGTGEVLRDLDPDSTLGDQVRDYLRRGDLVPNDLVLEVWQQHLREAHRQGRFHPEQDWILLDAYPRDVAQAELLEPHVRFERVVHLAVDDDEELKQRLRQRAARPDDRDDAVMDHRFQVYHQRTRPLLDHFDHDLVANVNAAAPPLQVLREVVQALVPTSH
jgi:adenylate kinase